MTDKPEGPAATPKVLYHYTDAGGFTGIVGSGKIWATDIRFLNDPRELKYAWEELLVALEEAKALKPEYSEAYDATSQAISLIDATDPDAIEDRIFSTSFSANGDELGQWRSYANDGKGFALGFDRDSIQVLKVPYFHQRIDGQLAQMKATVSETNKQVPFEWGSFTDEVKYGDPARKSAIDRVLYQVEWLCGKNGEGRLPDRLYNVINRIPIFLSELALVKTMTYRSEQEWRFTVAEYFGSSSTAMKKALSTVEEFKWATQVPLQTIDVKFRPGGRSSLKPYTEVPFKKSSLVRVVIGPNIESCERDRAVSTATRLLQRHGFWHTRVVPSDAEYRGV
ncbi:DUF2971 domain-containing protein [Mycobacteroides abscessus]|uniref:DUF2971 domain-containing protein n=1 Tax=Mycobacteroides abscessus TaxID=36809 RepID=UPI000C257270|nr:DUF2971 domain-containing protein [Mycobacteroides abscessus]